MICIYRCYEVINNERLIIQDCKTDNERVISVYEKRSCSKWSVMNSLYDLIKCRTGVSQVGFKSHASNVKWNLKNSLIKHILICRCAVMVAEGIANPSYGLNHSLSSSLSVCANE